MKANPALSKEELAEAIRSNNWRRPEDVATAARVDRGENPALYNTILRVGRRELQTCIEWIWQLEGEDEEPEVDRIAKLQYTAEHGRGACRGRWAPAAEKLMTAQGLDSVRFRKLVLRALHYGRGKTMNVLILGAPDAGKSFVFKVLPLIYKNTFIARGQGETFPLQGIHGSEVCVLQDVRYESFGLHWDDWLRWGEGESILVRLPRNQYEASKLYTGTAPLFSTMATMFSYPLAEAKRTQRQVELENEQFRSRWTVVRFPNPLPEERRDPTLRPCAKCGAQWYVSAWDPTDVEGQAPPPGNPPQLLAHTDGLDAAPQSGAPCPSEPLRKRLRTEPDPDDLWHRLTELMCWKSEGLLTPQQFENAKAALGL